MGHGIRVGLAVQSHRENVLTAWTGTAQAKVRGWPSSGRLPIGELKQRLPAKLLPLVDEYREKLEKLTAEQGGRFTLEKGDDPKELRRALKAAAVAVNRRVRFPFRGEEGSLSFYLEGQRGRRRGGRPKGAAATAGETPRRKRGRPRKATS
jgi:hypothetical protein